MAQTAGTANENYTSGRYFFSFVTKKYPLLAHDCHTIKTFITAAFSMTYQLSSLSNILDADSTVHCSIVQNKKEQRAIL